MTDRVWGSKKSRDLFVLPIVKHEVGDFDANEDDERRLLYVAMTRAKQTLVLTASQVNGDGKDQTASRFLLNLDDSRLVAIDTKEFEEAFSPVGDLRTLAPLPITTDIIIETLSERGFSPTAFNNYLKSPWEYFFRNILRVPQIKSTELQFGTAVHSVLDTLVRHKLSAGIAFTVNDISQLLERSFNQESITDEEYTRLHERGLAAIMVYGEHLKESVSVTSRTEVKLEASMETGIDEYPVLKLNGALDRVDYDGERIVKVVDYKTGKPKTRGHIEGTTADSTGDYKRQLTFYALLLSLQSDTAKHCRTGVLSFVEPDTHGTIKEEVFVITDEEIVALKQELIRVTKEIVSGQSLEVACDASVCHYCELVSKWQSK
jgi:DNA helicase-2/ATP-dependent DNA helicase PcrA